MMNNETRVVITAEDKTKAALDSVVGNLNGLQGALGGIDSIAGRLPAIGAAAAAAFGAISFTGIIKGSIDYADSLDDLSQRTGVSVEMLSSLRNAAELSGTTLESVGSAVQKLTRNMAEAASGSREQVENFKALGVAVTDNDGRLRSSSDVLLELARSVGELEDPTERVAAAQLALGKSGGDLVPLLLEISQNGLKAAEVTAEQAANAALLNDQLDIMKQEARGAGEAFSIILLPALAAVVDVAQGAMFAIKQIGSSLAVVANDIKTTVSVIGTALTEGPTQQGRDKIRALLDQRTRFVESANEDLEDRARKYRSTLQQILNPPEAAAGKGDGAGSSLSARLKQIRDEMEAGTRKTSASVKKQVDDMLKRHQEAAAQVRDILDKMEVGYSPEAEAAMEKQLDLQRQQANELERQVEYYKDLADPAAKFREQLEKIAELQQSGKLSSDQADKATAAINKQIDGLNGASDAARQLGLTFSSAFEDAIVGGKGFREVLEGILQDLVRLAARKTVTEPLLNALGSFNFSSMFSGSNGNSVMGIDLSGAAEDVFASLPSYDVGTPYVPKDMIARIHQGERILTASENRSLMAGSGLNMQVTVINNAGAQVNTRQRMTPQGPALDVMIDQAVAAKMNQPGSATSRTLGGLGARQPLVQR